jgi:hypothetical protein
MHPCGQFAGGTISGRMMSIMLPWAPSKAAPTAMATSLCAIVMLAVDTPAANASNAV